MQRANSLEKTLMLERLRAGGEGDGKRMRWLDSITDSMDRNVSQLQKTVKDRRSRHAEVHGVAKSGTWFSSWTTTTIYLCSKGRTGHRPRALSRLLYCVHGRNLLQIPFTYSRWYYLSICKSDAKVLLIYVYLCQKRVILKWSRDFPGGPVAKTPRSQHRAPGFDPWPGN